MRFNKALFLFAITTADAVNPDFPVRNPEPMHANKPSVCWFARNHAPAVYAELMKHEKRHGYPYTDSPFCQILSVAVESGNEDISILHQRVKRLAWVLGNDPIKGVDESEIQNWTQEQLKQLIFVPQRRCGVNIPRDNPEPIEMAFSWFAFSIPNPQNISTFCRVMRIVFSDNKEQEAVNVLDEMIKLYDEAAERIRTLDKGRKNASTSKGDEIRRHNPEPIERALSWTFRAFTKEHCKLHITFHPRKVVVAASDFIFSKPDEESIATFCEIIRSIL